MKRIRILTSQATPGMVISDDVYTTANQLIIPAGTTISNKVITRLKFYSIHQITVTVEDNVEVPEAVEMPGTLKEATATPAPPAPGQWPPAAAARR